MEASAVRGRSGLRISNRERVGRTRCCGCGLPAPPLCEGVCVEMEQEWLMARRKRHAVWLDRPPSKQPEVMPASVVHRLISVGCRLGVGSPSTIGPRKVAPSQYIGLQINTG
jgi:hypothetical protein